MVQAFCVVSRGVNVGKLVREQQGAFYGPLRIAAGLLRRGGTRPSAFVRFVYPRLRALRGRAPFPMEVFSRKAIEGWLPAYARGSMSVLDVPHYQTAPARRGEYARRFQRGIQGAVPLRSKFRESDRQAASRGPGAPP
jgi:hypothetical protein